MRVSLLISRLKNNPNPKYEIQIFFIAQKIPWWWILLLHLISLLCKSWPCDRPAPAPIDIRRDWIKDSHFFLALHHCSLFCFVSFLVQKRKITQSMICQHKIHFTAHPLESQWNCEIAVFNDIWLIAFEGGTKMSIKSHFFRMSSLLLFHICPVGCLAIFHTTHNQVDLSHTVL